MARPTYTEEFRAQAVALAVEFGPAEAARLVGGVAPGTVRVWCTRAGVVTVTSQEHRKSIEALAISWEKRRTEMVHRIGEVAEHALEHTELQLESGHLRNAKDAATTMAILVDKAQLLSGGATARTEHSAPETVHSKVDELAVRRRAA